MADSPLLLLDLPSVPHARIRNWAWSIAKMEFFERALSAICIMLTYLEYSAGALAMWLFSLWNLDCLAIDTYYGFKLQNLMVENVITVHTFL